MNRYEARKLQQKGYRLRGWMLTALAFALVPAFSSALIGLGLVVGILLAWTARGLTKI